MSPPTASSKLELQYPTISLDSHASPHSDPARPFNMDDAASDSTHDSLADSGYEIISNEAPQSDNDSRRDGTESLASFPGSAADEHEACLYDCIVQQVPQNAPRPDPVQSMASSRYSEVEDSSFTPRTITQSQFGSIMFDEPSRPKSGGAIEVEYALPESSAGPHLSWRETGAQDGFRATIRQTLDNKKLQFDNSPNRPFRLTYHGDLSHKEGIVEKIAQALAISALGDLDADVAAANSSRFNVIQMSSFGADETAPQVSLIPVSGLELLVNDCDLCSGRHDGDIQFRTKAALTHDCPLSGNGQETPDLAVYCHSVVAPQELDRITRETMVDMLVRSSRMSTRIPTLDISNTEHFYPGSLSPFKNDAIHMCVENLSSGSETQDGALRRLPIPVNHFLEVDARQLNRNIAYLRRGKDTGRGECDRIRNCDEGALKGIFGASLSPNDLMSRATSSFFSLSINGRIIALLPIVSFFLTWLATSMLQPRPDLTIGMPHRYPDESCVVATTDSSRGFAVETQASRLELEKSLTVTNTETGVQVVASSNPVNEPVHGDTKPLLLESADGKLFLRAPDAWANLYRTAPVLISASAKDMPVHVSLIQLNLTFYALNLDFDRARSVVDITVSAQQKPHAKYFFRLEQKSNWGNFKKLRKGIIAYMPTSTDISKWAGKEIAIFRGQASNIAVSSSDLTSKYLSQLRDTSAAPWKQLHERIGSRRDSIIGIVDSVRDREQAIMQSADKMFDEWTQSLSLRMADVQQYWTGRLHSVRGGADRTIAAGVTRATRRLAKVGQRVKKIELPRLSRNGEVYNFHSEVLDKARTRALTLLGKSNALFNSKRSGKRCSKRHFKADYEAAKERKAVHARQRRGGSKARTRQSGA